VFRGDSGFCRQRIINYCERADVGYIIGLAPRLQAIIEWVELAMRDAVEQTGLKQREVSEFMYAAQSWARQRWVITHLEFAQHANNSRYVVTNLTGQPQALYDDVYCQPG
jgi:Transposase DDE domain group 1